MVTFIQRFNCYIFNFKQISSIITTKHSDVNQTQDSMNVTMTDTIDIPHINWQNMYCSQIFFIHNDHLVFITFKSSTTVLFIASPLVNMAKEQQH